MKMMFNISAIILLFSCITMIQGQRGSFAGNRPQSGYKDKFRPEAVPTETSTQANGLSDRIDVSEGLALNATQRPPVFVNVVMPISEFVSTLEERIDGNTNVNLSAQNPIPVPVRPEVQNPETSTRLPFDALGDKELVDRLNRLPVDQRPFWLINAQAIEAHRNRVAAAQMSQQNLAQQQQFGSLFIAQQLGLVTGGQAQGVNQTSNRIPIVGRSLTQQIQTPAGPVNPINQQISTNDPLSVGNISEPKSNISKRSTDEVSTTTIEPNSAGFPNYGNLKE